MLCTPILISVGGVFISFTEVAFLDVYLSFAVLWTILLAGWLIWVLPYALSSFQLQWFAVLPLALRAMTMVFAYIYWRRRETGASEREYDLVLLPLLLTLDAVSFIAFCVLLLLVSTGWRIMNPKLPPSVKRFIFIFSGT